MKEAAFMRRLCRPVTALFVALVMLWPTLALAQAAKAGVVTTLEGSATAARSALPQPVALKFKDDVFQNDRIVTGDRSIVRMLLGGKAVVTVRERSSLTITEVPGKSTIDLDNGKIAVAVAKDRMRPGESIEVKTPNAVAAVRGTVFVTEVIRATASADAAQGTATTNFYGFAGSVLLNFNGQLFNLLGDNFASGTGSGPVNFGNMTAAMRLNAAAGLHPKTQNASGGQNGARDNAMGVTVATFPGGGLELGGGDQGGGFGGNNLGGGGGNHNYLLPGGKDNLGGNDNKNNGGGTAPGAAVTPNSITNPVVSPAFGQLATNGLITDQYKAFGLLFGPARVGIFSDPPNAWGGVNSDGYVDLVSPVETSLVMPGTTTPAKTAHISVEVGYAAVGSILLEAFNSTGVLIGSAHNGSTLGPHGRTLAILDIAGIHSFRVSGSDTWGIDEIDYGDLVDPPAVLTLDGPLFRSVGEQRDAYSAFIDLIDGAITGTGTDPLVWVSGSALRTVRSFALLTNSTLTAAGSFLRVDEGGSIVQTGGGDPLVAVSGGSLAVGTSGAGHLFDLVGRAGNTRVDGDTGLTLGTDQPLQPGAESPVFEATHGAVVTVAGSAYRVDTALLEATAPLLNITGGAALTTGSHAVDLVGRAKVAIPNDAVALVNVNGGTLSVTNGHLVNVAGGSSLNVAGSLLSLTGGSTVNIFNGLLLNVTGGSNVSIGKSLVSFSGTGNLLNITNSFVPTALIGGIPVYGPVDSFRVSGNALAGLGTAGTIKINGVALTPTTPLSRLTGSLVAVQGNGTLKVGN
jgi:hypothetical protein